MLGLVDFSFVASLLTGVAFLEEDYISLNHGIFVFGGDRISQQRNGFIPPVRKGWPEKAA